MTGLIADEDGIVHIEPYPYGQQLGGYRASINNELFDVFIDDTLPPNTILAVSKCSVVWLINVGES